MKKHSIYVVALSFVISFLVSCNTEPTLQKYFIESNKNDKFITFDIPSTVLSLKEENTSEEVKNTLKSIKKVNFIGFQIKEDNMDEFKVEKQKIQRILENPKYQEILSMNGSKTLTIKYLGKDDAIDEVIVFGADATQGFALVRLLGNKMNPSKIVQLIHKIKFNGNKEDFKGLETLFKKV